MSIEFLVVEHGDSVSHGETIQHLLNIGWQIVSNHVTFDTGDFLHYTSFMQRDTTPAPQNGVYMASLLEVLEKRVAELVERVEVLEATADTDDELPADRIKVFDIHGTLIDLINPHKSQFIPLSSVYDDVIYEALSEDEQDVVK